MKLRYVFLTLLVASGILSLSLYESQLPELTSPSSPITIEVEAQTEPTPHPPSPTSPTSIPNEVSALAEQVKQIDNELAAMGFPSILGDERTSEEERSKIIAKLRQVTELQVALNKLKLKAIDTKFAGGL